MKRTELSYHTTKVVSSTTPRTTTTQTTTTTTEEASSPSLNRTYLNYLDDTCGVSDFRRPQSTGLIKGGMVVSRGQFPWLTAYFYTGKYSTEFICGGSLISSKLIITAAHCIEGPEADSTVRKAEHSTFFIGKNKLDSLTGEMFYVTSTAAFLHVHPNWKAGAKLYENDIAIAVLVKKVEFNKYVKPICIWRDTTSYEDIINKPGIVTGWGKTDELAISSSAAMYVKIPAVSNEKCLRSHQRFFDLLADNAFCAGIKDSNIGPCSGDSGE